MRRLIWIVLVMMMVLPIGVIRAQDEEPTPDLQATLQALVEQAEESAERASDASETAQQASENVNNKTDEAFNLLGLFEAFSVILAVVATALSVFGFNRVFRAQEELTKARDDVAHQLEELKKQFDVEVAKQRAELQTLQRNLEAGAEKRRVITERALLAQAYIPLGERQYKAQDYTGAITTYKQALELDPNNPVLHYRLGYVYTQKGDLDDAKYHYEHAMQLADNFAPAMAGLGYVYRRIGERMDEGVERKQMMNRAEELLLEAMNLSPKLVDDDGESWWGILGGLYRRRGQVDDAIYAYKQATIVTPQSSYGFGNLALLYMQKNQREEMLETYAEVEKLAGAEAAAEVNNYWGHADLVVSRYALGKSEEAVQVLERAIQIAPLESPYMLEGLQGTLEDLTKVLEPEKIPALKEAVKRIADEQVRREKLLVQRREEEAKPAAEQN